jgi:hypothetical protein
MSRIKLTFCTMIFALCLAGAAKADEVTYKASKGTTPAQQGYNWIGAGAASPSLSVSNGILYQGLTAYRGVDYGERADVPFNFGVGFVMEATIKIISSTILTSAQNNGNGQRAGYYFSATDSLGRMFNLGLADTGFFLTTDQGTPTNGIPLTPFNTTSGFHNYKLQVSSGVGKLFIDSRLVGSTPIGTSNLPGFAINPPNTVWFGDGTYGGNSQIELATFTYLTGSSAVSAIAAPEPSTLLIAFFGMGGLLAHRRKKRCAIT